MEPSPQKGTAGPLIGLPVCPGGLLNAPWPLLLACYVQDPPQPLDGCRWQHVKHGSRPETDDYPEFVESVLQRSGSFLEQSEQETSAQV